MKKFKVQVSRRIVEYLTVEIDADSADHAKRLVKRIIADGDVENEDREFCDGYYSKPRVRAVYEVKQP